MKIPPHIRSILQLVKIGGVILTDDDGLPAIYAALPFDRITMLKAPSIIEPPSLHIYHPEGPIVRFLVIVQDTPTNPFYVEIFVDPTNEVHRKLISPMVMAPRIRFHVFQSQPKLPHLATKTLEWSDLQRESIEKYLVESVNHKTDFTAAKNRYMTEHPGIGYGMEFKSLLPFGE